MLEAIRQYKEDLKNKEVEKVSSVSLDLSKNVLINPSAFKAKMGKIDEMSDEELYSLVFNSYPTIFSESFITEDKKNLERITHPRFINACINVFSNIKDIPYTVKLFCNKIIYDYNIAFRDEEHEYMRGLLFALGRVVNKDKIYILTGLGLPEVYAVNILICRYSSTKERTNIARMNYYICKQDEETMTEQMIIWIYEKLFDVISEVFQVVMFYPWDETQNEEVYSTMSNSILDIIENMPFNSIKHVLRDYTIAYESGAYNRKFLLSDQSIVSVNSTYTRFSLRALSADYSRINQAVEELYEQESIYVP